GEHRRRAGRSAAARTDDPAAIGRRLDAHGWRPRNRGAARTMTTRRLIAAAAGAMTFALCAVVLHLSPLALVRLTLLGAALGAVVESDLDERRIPNRIVVPTAAACAAAWTAGGIALFALVEGFVLVGALL